MKEYQSPGKYFDATLRVYGGPWYEIRDGLEAKVCSYNVVRGIVAFNNDYDMPLRMLKDLYELLALIDHTK
jgi:hypothetical protein